MRKNGAKYSNLQFDWMRKVAPNSNYPLNRKKIKMRKTVCFFLTSFLSFRAKAVVEFCRFGTLRGAVRQ